MLLKQRTSLRPINAKVQNTLYGIKLKMKSKKTYFVSVMKCGIAQQCNLPLCHANTYLILCVLTFLHSLLINLWICLPFWSSHSILSILIFVSIPTFYAYTHALNSYLQTVSACNSFPKVFSVLSYTLSQFVGTMLLLIKPQRGNQKHNKHSEGVRHKPGLENLRN